MSSPSPSPNPHPGPRGGALHRALLIVRIVSRLKAGVRKLAARGSNLPGANTDTDTDVAVVAEVDAEPVAVAVTDAPIATSETVQPHVEAKSDPPRRAQDHAERLVHLLQQCLRGVQLGIGPGMTLQTSDIASIWSLGTALDAIRRRSSQANASIKLLADSTTRKPSMWPTWQRVAPTAWGPAPSLHASLYSTVRGLSTPPPCLDLPPCVWESFLGRPKKYAVAAPDHLQKALEEEELALKTPLWPLVRPATNEMLKEELS